MSSDVNASSLLFRDETLFKNQFCSLQLRKTFPAIFVFRKIHILGV